MVQKDPRYTAVTVGTGVTALVDANPDRTYLRIVNSSSADIYIGTDKNVSSSDGMILEQYKPYEVNRLNMYKGPLYAVTASSTASVRILELSGG